MQQVTYLKDYQPPKFVIEVVQLDVNLAEDVTTVTAKMSMSGDGSSPLVLVGEQLVLKSVSIDGKPTKDYQQDDKSLTINKVPKQFLLETVVEIKPHENTALSGLYKSNDMYCTQCEAHGFRKITYYLDRPDVMSKFIVTIHGDKKKYPVLLSNGNLIDSGLEEGGRHYVTWEDPFKKPCYLFALVAGDLVALEDNYVTMNGKLVKLKLYIERENIEQTPHAMEALKKSMRWDEEKYGREYDLDIYMTVAVNDFNMGAMENKGLNIFNSKYILVSSDTATDHDYEGVDMVVGHEYFHNWSGNRVTCRDWFQLSLKEGFTVFREQQFTQDVTASPVVRIENARMMMTRQFAEDAGPLAHPVRPDSYIEINNFYTVTVYEKGAEVIRMMHTLLGPEKFRAGTDLYFSKYDGMAVTTDDFAAAMQEASRVDLTQFKLWYTQAGTPQIEVKDYYDADARKYVLTLKQRIPDTPGQIDKLPMHIPIHIGLLDQTGNDMPIAEPVLSLTKAEQDFEFTDINEKPILSVLRDFSAPVQIHRDVSLEELAFLFANDSDNFARWFSGQKLYEKVLFDLDNIETLTNSFKKVLIDTQLNTSLRAELLKLPSFAQLVTTNIPADPDNIHRARKQVRKHLTQTLRSEMLEVYNEHVLAGPYQYKAEHVASRSLKNLMLVYLLQVPNDESIKLAMKQYHDANNMTDKVAVLTALGDVDCPERTEIFDDFYSKWASNPLVVNKWLSIQAYADVSDSLERVQKLMQHKAFDIKNPNKVYALVGGFCMGNQPHFHHKSGSGYKFLADTVIKLNSLNPQVAARMLTPLTEWNNFITQRQELMQEELQRIRGTAKLSPDVYEIVSKSLSE